jgi:hypothetical protein
MKYKTLLFTCLGIALIIVIAIQGPFTNHLMINFCMGFLVYFVPSFVSVLNKHPQSNGITVLNLFLGWTVLGWVGALIWACCKKSIPA